MTSTDSNSMYGDSNRQLVYDHLRDAIARGDYPPGTRLINRTIAKEMGTSFAPVREAICQLFSDGLVEMQPGIGAYVKVADRREIEELLVLREELEGRAAQEAARHITARQLDRLQSICDTWKQILRNRKSADGTFDLTESDIVEIVELDHQFHGIIIRAANNRVLTKTLMNVRLLARIFRAMKDGEVEFQQFSPISWAWIWREHASLVRALRRGDGTDARRWIVRQVLETRRQFMDYFDYKEQAHVKRDAHRVRGTCCDAQSLPGPPRLGVLCVKTLKHGKPIFFNAEVAEAQRTAEEKEVHRHGQTTI